MVQKLLFYQMEATDKLPGFFIIRILKTIILNCFIVITGLFTISGVMRKLSFFLLLLSAQLVAQQNPTFNGYVRDVQNGEELIGVSVYILTLKAVR
jgi:hypothetical protein